MGKTTLHFVMLGIILVLAQVIVFNHVCLFGVAVPFVFIYLLLRLPITMPVWQVLTVGFVAGLTVDSFADTPGMNAMACVIIAMCRRSVFRLYFNREDDLSNPEPSIRTLGFNIYLKYALTMTLIYCSVMFTLEGIVIFRPLMMLLRTIASTVLTTALILGIDSITDKKREKRL